MQVKSAQIISIKKLKKDGSFGTDIIQRIIEALLNNQNVLMPIDNVYGIAGLNLNDLQERFSFDNTTNHDHMECLISSFRMLDDIADYSKSDYDFLNRIWPGEVSVVFNCKNGLKKKKPLKVRYPKTRFFQYVVEEINKPLYYLPALKDFNKPVYKKSELIKYYGDRADCMVLIDELCKKHPLPTLIDIKDGKLMILHEGKISSDEIKSLYFLG